MPAIRLITIRLMTICVLLVCVGSAVAQSSKKLYCWNDNGHKICGDALPPGATDLARTEISARSGMRTGEVGRAPTDTERTTTAVAQAQAQAAALAEAARLRRDLAMVESYATEADLRSVYNERISVLDGALKASVLSEANLRRSLVSLLDQASTLELAGKPVPTTTVANLRSQHVELLKQQRILIQQHLDRASVGAELADAVRRYRALKHPESILQAEMPAPSGG